MDETTTTERHTDKNEVNRWTESGHEAAFVRNSFGPTEIRANLLFGQTERIYVPLTIPTVYKYACYCIIKNNNVLYVNASQNMILRVLLIICLVNRFVMYFSAYNTWKFL